MTEQHSSNKRKGDSSWNGPAAKEYSIGKAKARKAQDEEPAGGEATQTETQSAGKDEEAEARNKTNHKDDWYEYKKRILNTSSSTRSSGSRTEESEAKTDNERKEKSMFQAEGSNKRKESSSWGHPAANEWQSMRNAKLRKV